MNLPLVIVSPPLRRLPQSMYLFSKTEVLAKIFFMLSFTGLLMYVILAFYSFHTAYSTVTQIGEVQNEAIAIPHPDLFKARRFDNDLKYILLWNPSNKKNPIGEGQLPFIQNNCSNINCFFTSNKDILDADYRNFDALLFNMSLITYWRNKMLPQKRTPAQKYIFHSMLPSNENPICNVNLDKYFNWTWSYKLYSDIVTPFIEVRHRNGSVVAPNTDLEWPSLGSNYTNIEPKTRAVAFVTGKCKLRTKGLAYGKELKHFLKEHNLDFDIYGCGGVQCTSEDCRNDGKTHYFQLVYEESGSEDYVNQEVFDAFNNKAVPILAGGSDFARFFPDGSYIDARDLYPERLAAIIYYAIRNPAIYNGYHQWRDFYSMHPVNSLRGLCGLCDLLNDEKRVKSHTSYEMFRKWWYYGPLHERCYPKGAESFSEILSYVNTTKKRSAI